VSALDEPNVSSTDEPDVSTAYTDGLNYASVGQTYQTTISADDLPSVLFLSVPRRGEKPGMRDLDEECQQIFHLDGVTSSKRLYPAELAWALWYCITDGRDIPTDEDDRSNWPVEDRRLMEFAEYLAFEDVIPFELSAQQSRSLAKLMVAGSGAGLTLGAVAAGAKVGAAGGIAIGAPAGPLVFITAPAGFVVGGLVGAVTSAFGENIFNFLSRSPRPKKA
jgi:hypothetical protein